MRQWTQEEVRAEADRIAPAWYTRADDHNVLRLIRADRWLGRGK